MVCEWFDLKTTQTVFSGLASKPAVTVFSGLASKPVGRVFRFGPQNQQLWFGELGFKITATVSWFVPQNQADFSLSVVPQYRWREDSARHASRSGSFLHLEASRARVFQSSLKTGGAVMAGVARCSITEVALGSN
jgi:hypothetical protein